MDLTYYFSDKKRKNMDNMILYSNKLSELINQKLIDLLEYEFLINFFKNRSIINMNWFLNLINKINDEKINQICCEKYEELFTISEKKLILNFEQMSKKLLCNFDFSDDQKKALSKILNFIIDYNKPCFGLYGYAGTGKTTIIVELISYLIKKNLIKNIVFTAPTNKALNIIKSKFRVHLKNIYENKFKTICDNNFNMDDLLYELNKKNIIIDFCTVHKLLNYQVDYNSEEGSKIFVKKNNTNVKKLNSSNIRKYEIVIIDECSMLPYSMIQVIFEDVRNHLKGNDLKKVPKIIFTGDKAQLNAVNEINNILFAKNTKEENNNLLSNDIKNMDTIIMKTVMRSKIPNIISLSINIRQWLEYEIKSPEPGKFVGKGVYKYIHDEKTKKIDSSWFKKYLKNFDNSENNLCLNIIILTWTNNQCNEYNNTVRNMTFNKKNEKDKIIGKYEIGDIIIFGDFYNIGENKFKTEKDKEKYSFSSSEQLKIINCQKSIYTSMNFSSELPKSTEKIKNINFILSKYKNLVKGMNLKTKRTYEVWNLSVCAIDSKENVYKICVIDDNSKKNLEDEKIYCSNIIKNFRKSLLTDYKEQSNSIDNIIIKQLWREWNKIFFEPFAEVNYGCSITTHMSQSSTYEIVFVDIDDIFKNSSRDECIKCLYTAITRSSKEVHMLV